jgi:putative thioredoxin
MLGPVLEKLAAEAAGAWELVKVNTDDNPELAVQFGLRGIPDVRLFHRGEVLAQFNGAAPEPQVRHWLAEHLPTPKRETMARVRELLHAGRAAEAERRLQAITPSGGADGELTALLARALVFSQPVQAAALIESLRAPHPWEEAATIVREFARLFTLAGPALAAVQASPLGARYQAAIRELRAEHFEDAFIQLIAVLQEDPQFDDGHARAAGRALFQHLGVRHPLSEKFSRAFSMAVNV